MDFGMYECTSSFLCAFLKLYSDIVQILNANTPKWLLNRLAETYSSSLQYSSKACKPYIPYQLQPKIGTNRITHT